MIAVDSSVVIAAFATWHDAHDAAFEAIERSPHLVDHCALESYSVLTRLPAPHRVGGDAVLGFLERWFKEPWLKLDSRDYRRFVSGLAGAGIAGGSVYDALVAATASRAGATLVSLDRRALATYERLGVRTTLLC